MLKLISTQCKVTDSVRTEELKDYEIGALTALRKESCSFQILYRNTEEELCRPVSVQVNCGGLPLSVFRIDCVPVVGRSDPFGEKVGYLSAKPGLYPDLLTPRPAAPALVAAHSQGTLSYYESDTDAVLNSVPYAWQGVWVTLNPHREDLPAGEYLVSVELITLTGEVRTETAELSFTVIDEILPEIDFFYTNWFHVDCLCDHYGVTPYSEAFYKLFRSYVCNAVDHGMNTLLLPSFTPALDTPVGQARRQVQLTEIEKTREGWSFDFTRLDRYVKEALACGITKLEHCHLFSQWGAAHAPNIYDRNGTLLFGWNTDAKGEEYLGFVRAYLTAFLSYAKQAGLKKEQLLFHLSDEPCAKEAQIRNYRSAFETVRELLCDYEIIDAMSDPEFFRLGLTKTPVAEIKEAKVFADLTDRFALYYTSGAYEVGCPIRLITNTPQRTRALGLWLYYYRAKGFLHWGYNYYYDRMSSGRFDPRSNPCGYKLLPGASYLAYPLEQGAAPSVREKLMAQAMSDLQALYCLEKKIGRAGVLSLCQMILESELTVIPEGNVLDRLRSAVNDAIAWGTGKK